MKLAKKLHEIADIHSDLWSLRQIAIDLIKSEHIEIEREEWTEDRKFMRFRLRKGHGRDAYICYLALGVVDNGFRARIYDQTGIREIANFDITVAWSALSDLLS